MRFPWTPAPKRELLQTEILSESEIKERFESIAQFMFEYQKQYFEGLKFSLNMWILINSGSAIALLNSGNEKLIVIAIPLMCGVLLTGAASAYLSNCMYNKIEKLFKYTLKVDISRIELYASLIKSFSSLRENITFVISVAYLLFGLSILLLAIQIF